MKKQTIIPIITLFLLVCNMLKASDYKWEITGQLIETETGEILPYATVTLNSIQDSLLIAGSISNDQGVFKLEKITKGNYYLKISFIGYKDLFINQIILSEQVSLIKLGQIELHPDYEMLGEVEVTGKISPVSKSLDKQVINVEKNISVSGGTAVDALLLSPSIQVDGEGKVKLRGSSEFIVLINGKPTTLSADEVLRQTPANLISKIEVITNPSVKYNAEGGAGVINIILKKGAISGFNGMVNAMIGTKDKYSGDLSLNLNRDKLSFSAGFEWRDYTKTAIHNYYRELYKSDTVQHAFMGQDRIIRESNLGFRFGVDYNLNDKNNLSYSFHTGYTSVEADIMAKTSGYTSPEDTKKNMVNTFYLLQKPTFFTNNFSYTRTLNDKGSNLTANVYYSYIDYQLYTSQVMSKADDNYNIIDDEPYLKDITNDNYSHDNRVDIDYTLPISEKTSFETGGSAHGYNRFLDVTYAQFNYEVNDWVNHPEYTNKYDFKEDVYAGYVNINTSFWSISATAGMRMEYMDRLLSQHTSEQEFDYTKLNFFPAFSFSKSFKEIHSLSFSMSNRINRPDEYMMNPFPEFEDDYFYSEGNPFLIPEIVRNLELGYQFTGDKNVLSSNLYYRQTTDKIEQKLIIGDDDKINLTFHNDAMDRAIGLEMMGNIDIAEWWSLNANVNLFHYNIKGTVEETEISKSDFNWNTQLVSSFTIKESTSIQLIGYYSSKSHNLQYYVSDFYFVDLAVKHQFFDGKLSVNLQLKDIFQSFNYDLITKAQNADLTGNFINESPIFMINVSYQISNYKKKTRDVETEFDM